MAIILFNSSFFESAFSGYYFEKLVIFVIQHFICFLYFQFNVIFPNFISIVYSLVIDVQHNKNFNIKYPYNSKYGKIILSFNSSFDYTTKYTGAKPIRQYNVIDFNGISFICRWGQITDLDKFLKKPHNVVLSWCNLTIHV